MSWAIYLMIRICTKEKSCPIPILVLWELDKSLKLSFTDFMLILETTIFITTITGYPHGKLNLVLNSCSLTLKYLSFKAKKFFKRCAVIYKYICEFSFHYKWVISWLHDIIMSNTHFRVNLWLPECQGTPCSKQAQYLKLSDSNRIQTHNHSDPKWTLKHSAKWLSVCLQTRWLWGLNPVEICHFLVNISSLISLF